MSSESHVNRKKLAHLPWKNAKLGDLIDLRGGLSYKSEFISDAGNSLVTMGCVSLSQPFKLTALKRYTGVFGDQHRLDVGDIVIATRDVTQNRELIGAPALIPSGLPGEAILVATNLYKVINQSEVGNRFLYWVMRSPSYRRQIIASAKGTTVVMLTKDAVLNYQFPLPAKEEREQIVHLLDSLNDRIALLRDTNATLEAIAQALFKSWFVDFDPVLAKMEGRAPEGMDEATAALFPDSFEESELGLMPTGWATKKLDEISDVGIGKTPPRKEPEWFSESCEDVPWVSIRDMGSSGVYIANTSECLVAQAIERFNVRRVPDNTVLLSFKLTVGRVSITDGEMTTNEAIAHCKLDPEDLLSTEFIYLYLKQFNFGSLGSTSSIAEAVNSKTIKSIPIIVPSGAVVVAFNSLVSGLFQRLKENEHQAQTLTDLRDTLLPRMISGQLRLPEGEDVLATAI